LKIFSSNKAQKTKVEIYSKPDCHLCEEAKIVLQQAQRKFDFQLLEINILEAPEVYDEYKEKIPVVFIDGRKAFKYRIDYESLIKKLKGTSKFDFR
jgi:glutaredoxin